MVFLAAVYQLYMLSAQHVRFGEGGGRVGGAKAKLTKW